MQHQEIKDCPWCPAEDLSHSHDQVNDMWFVFCMNCWAQGPQWKTIEEAIEAWNERQ
jgi:hypothetical protein